MRKHFRSAVSLVLVFVMLLSCSVSAFANTSVLNRDPEQIKADAIDVMTNLLDTYIAEHSDLGSKEIKDDVVDVMTTLWTKYIYEHVNSEREELPDSVIADVETLIDEIIAARSNGDSAGLKNYVAEMKVKYAEDLYDATHNKYAPAKGDIYVAIGGADVNALGLSVNDGVEGYYKQLATKLGVDCVYMTVDPFSPLSSSAALNLIKNEKNVATIEDATLITYQPDASAFVLAKDPANWGKYFSAGELALMKEMKGIVLEIIAADWNAYKTEVVSEIAVGIREDVLSQLPAGLVPENEETVDLILELCVAMVKAAADMAGFDVLGAYEKINELTKGMAESVIFGLYSYVVDTIKVLEELQKINPNATILVLGLYNNYNGMTLVRNGAEVDLAKYMDYFFDLTNLYNTAYAVADGNVAFVDITGTTTAGLDMDIDVNNLDYFTLFSQFSTKNMHANAAGHAYIAEQILAALEIKENDKPEYVPPVIDDGEGEDGSDEGGSGYVNNTGATFNPETFEYFTDEETGKPMVSFELTLGFDEETGEYKPVNAKRTYLVWVGDEESGQLAEVEVTEEGGKKTTTYIVEQGAKFQLYILGDQTGDGVLNYVDALGIFYGTAKKALQKAVYDFNGDGAVNYIDSLAVFYN